MATGFHPHSTKLVAIVGTYSVVVRETSFGRWVVRVLDLEGNSVNSMLTPYAYRTARAKARDLALELIAGTVRVRGPDGKWRAIPLDDDAMQRAYRRMNEKQLLGCD